MPEITPDAPLPDAFVRHRWMDWTALEVAAARRPRTLADLQRIETLRAGVREDWASARRQWPNDRIVDHLDDLLTRSNVALAVGPRFGWRSFRRAVFEIPAATRSLPLLTSASVLGLSTLAAFVLVRTRPDAFEIYLDEGLRDRIAGIVEAHRVGQRPTWVHVADAQAVGLSTSIASNNIQVALLAVGGGFTAGLFTLHVLVTNGLLLGLVMGVALNRGAGEPLFEFLAAHAGLELSVMVVAGAAGLAIGRAILDPEGSSRAAAVRTAAHGAVTAGFGVTLCLLVAALIEAFVSPNSDLASSVKLGLGVASLLGYWAAMLAPGKTRFDRVGRDLRTFQRDTRG